MVLTKEKLFSLIPKLKFEEEESDTFYSSGRFRSYSYLEQQHFLSIYIYILNVYDPLTIFLSYTS